MKIAYFDCLNGAAGDMLVASLLSAGGDLQILRSTLNSLNLENYTVDCEPVSRHGISASYFSVDVQLDKQPHRHLSHILTILNESALPDRIQSRATSVFQKLGEAEAAVHGCSIEQVHFHEVGAVDAIVDIVSVVALLEQLGVDDVYASPVPVGSGTVKCDHGILPVPAPATAELMKGIPIAPTEEIGELTTPTGAALLSTLCSGFGAIPAMSLTSTGYGAGTREGKNRPNILRVLIGDKADTGSTDEIFILECDLDDTTGEVIAHCCEELFNQGVLDATCLPIYGKKSRPGTMIRVMVRPEDADRIESIMFAEVPTFGVRRYPVRRSKLERSHETVTTTWGPVRMKVGRRGKEVLTAAPEFEDCRNIACKNGVPVRVVLDTARNIWKTGTFHS